MCVLPLVVSVWACEDAWGGGDAGCGFTSRVAPGTWRSGLHRRDPIDLWQDAVAALIYLLFVLKCLIQLLLNQKSFIFRYKNFSACMLTL